MNDVLELINEVRQTGATLRADPPDLVITPASRVPPDLKARLKEHKAELLALLQTRRLEARLEHLGIRIAIDRQTGEACLVFTESDAEAARSVAEVCRPFERSL